MTKDLRQKIETALYRNLPPGEVNLFKDMLLDYLVLSTDESSIRAIISGIIETDAESAERCICEIVAIHRASKALPLSEEDITELNEEAIRLETIRS